VKTKFVSKVLGGSALILILGTPGVLGAQTTQATPTVFQAAGPTVASIQGTVDQFRAALGDNLGNVPGGVSNTGRREINWDGGGSTATSIGETPFDVFLNNRGARMTTDGSGFVQAPVAGIATTFNNPGYETAFQFFSQQRLFSPIDSNFTLVQFFIPGTNGDTPATTKAFGVVFTDVDRQSSGTLFFDATFAPGAQVEFFDARGKLLYFQYAPASRGNAGLSFLGVIFDDARIAFVRIRSGSVTPGPDDNAQHDIVMMDDFIFGEPQQIIR
jgi:hypothetical protein